MNISDLDNHIKESNFVLTDEGIFNALKGNPFKDQWIDFCDNIEVWNNSFITIAVANSQLLRLGSKYKIKTFNTFEGEEPSYTFYFELR